MTKRLSMTEDEALHVLGYSNNTGRYKFSNPQKWKEALDKRTEYRDKFSKYCRDNNIDQNDVSLYWDKSKEFSILVRPQSTTDKIDYSFIQEAVKDLKLNKTPKVKPVQSDEVLRVIITDVHVGMETDDKGYGLYPKVWNENILYDYGQRVINEISKYKTKFKEVHVIDLGDYLDGWNGLTTRGGHGLPQNMSNRKAFKVGVKFKTELYSNIQTLLNCPLIAYNVCNDNHSSDFGFIVNETVKMVSESSNSNITVNNLQSFFSHYTIGKHCFILSHGKDEQHMRFGLKVKLDAVIEAQIKQYIDYYKLNDYYITFEKGDSHQQLLDSTSSEIFDYNNYRAFSPASSWVKSNFKLGTCGFTLMTLELNEKAKGIKAVEF